MPGQWLNERFQLKWCGLRHTMVNGTAIALETSGTHFPSSPVALVNGRESCRAMNTLKKTIFTLVAVVGLSLAVSAQRDDQKKPPPKDPDRPVVTPKDKPPKDQPKGGDKPKKPSFALYLAAKRIETEIA